MSRPTIDRQNGKFVLRDIEEHYHVELSRRDVARLAAEASQLLYIDVACEGVIPEVTMVVATIPNSDQVGSTR